MSHRSYYRSCKTKRLSLPEDIWPECDYDKNVLLYALASAKDRNKKLMKWIHKHFVRKGKSCTHQRSTTHLFKQNIFNQVFQRDYAPSHLHLYQQHYWKLSAKTKTRRNQTHLNRQSTIIRNNLWEIKVIKKNYHKSHDTNLQWGNMDAFGNMI